MFDPSVGNEQCRLANAIDDGSQVALGREEYEKLHAADAEVARLKDLLQTDADYAGEYRARIAELESERDAARGAYAAYREALERVLNVACDACPAHSEQCGGWRNTSTCAQFGISTPSAPDPAQGIVERLRLAQEFSEAVAVYQMELERAPRTDWGREGVADAWAEVKRARAAFDKAVKRDE